MKQYTELLSHEDGGSGGLACGAKEHGPQLTFSNGYRNLKREPKNFMMFNGSITFFSSTTRQVTRAGHTDASDANASVTVIDKSFQVHAKFRETDTHCYSISHSFHVKREI